MVKIICLCKLIKNFRQKNTHTEIKPKIIIVKIGKKREQKSKAKINQNCDHSIGDDDIPLIANWANKCVYPS